MTTAQRVLTILLVAGGTMLTRFLPFLLFRGNRPVPAYVRYLGRMLPPAVFAMLVVYCLKDVDFLAGPYGIPEAIAVLTVAGLHLWKGKMLLSIAGGTTVYMVLVQFVLT